MAKMDTGWAARMWPLLATLPGYGGRDFASDLGAGAILAAIAIPEQMATAHLAGFPPQAGFIAFIAGSVGFFLFGASRFLSAGADSTITPIFAGSLALLAAAGSPHSAGLAAALALLVGTIVLAGGVFRLGWIADLLSVPVTTGFLAGIALHIVASQLPGLLGVAGAGGTLPHQLAAIARSVRHANPYAAGLGSGVLLATIACERISARLPGPLIGILAATFCVACFGLQQRGVAVLGDIGGAWPAPGLPSITFADFIHILPVALVVALVVMLQTAAVARAFPATPGEAPQVNRDFTGVGLGSVLAGLFGSFPVNASPPRTAIVAETGGRTQFGGLTAAALVLAMALFGAKLLAHVPEAALAGILLFIALRIVRVPEMARIYARARGEFALVAATALAIAVLPIAIGVASGIAVSLLHGMWMTNRTRVIEFEKIEETSIWWAPSPQNASSVLPGVLVAAYQAPLSFLNAYDFRSGIAALIARRPAPLKLLVLEASSIIALDYTAANILGDVIRDCRRRGMDFAVARLESVRAQTAFEQFGITALLGEDHIFRSVDEAVRVLGGANKST